MLILNPGLPRWVAPVGIAAGAVAVAVATAFVVRRALDRSRCAVGPEGGTVAGVSYLERIRGGASPGERLPMVILFHGKDGSPSGYTGSLTGIGKARVILPQGFYQSGNGYKWWDRGVAEAVKPKNIDKSVAQWNDASDRIAEFIRHITRCRPTAGKPIVTGSSQGGEMTLLLASRFPRKVHGGVAVSSYLLEPFWNNDMAPIAMIHGTGDRVVPLSWAKEYADKMRSEGAPIRFDAFPSTGHDVTHDMGQAWISRVHDMVEQVREEA